MTQSSTLGTLGRLADAIEKLSISQKTVLTTEEAATYLGYKPSTIRTYAGNGEIPYSVRGHQMWFRREALDEWVCADRSKRQSDLDRRAEEYMRTLEACSKRKKA